MNKFSDYKKAVDILFGIGGWREIGGYIDENGIRTPAIAISNKMEYQNEPSWHLKSHSFSKLVWAYW